jgi:hypothetical protein
MEDNIEIQAYLVKMRNAGTWASEPEMAALATALNFNVVVHEYGRAPMRREFN